MKDATRDLDLVVALPFGAYTTAQTGADVPLDQISGVGIYVIPTAIAGTHLPTVEESDDGTTGWSAVDPANLIGAFVNLSANTPQKISYIGLKTHIRITSTSSGGTGNFGVLIAKMFHRSIHDPAAV